MSRIALAVGLMAATFAFADAAHASFTATVKQQTLVLTGKRAADSVALRLRGRTVKVAGLRKPYRRVKQVVIRARGGSDRIQLAGRGPRVTVSGGRGLDRLTFVGSSNTEAVRLSREGRLNGTRLAAIERVDLFTGAGADTVALEDQSATAVRTVNADLGGADGATDRVIVDGTASADAIQAGDAVVTGLVAAISLTGRELDRDQLAVHALDGDDSVSGAALTTSFTVDGGPGADTLSGGPLADTLLGGDGGDRFVWRPGDGNDSADGQAGDDVMAFNGSADTELVTVAENRVTRNDVETTALAGIERLELATLEGADDVRLADLGGLAVSAGLGDDVAFDRVMVSGTAGADTLGVSGDASAVTVNRVALRGAEKLVVDALDGADSVDSTALAPDAVQYRAVGGPGDDTLTGGAAREVLEGGDGNDVVSPGRGQDNAPLGDGDDRYIWRVGDGPDEFDGGAGRDRLNAEGARLTLASVAGGAVTRLADSVSGQAVDFIGAEELTTSGCGFLAIEDLGLSALAAIEASLDGFGDVISIRGGAGPDVADVDVLGPGRAAVTGLLGGRTVTTAGADAFDLLEIAGRGGADRTDAADLPADLIDLHFVGGDGNDALVGGDGDDFMAGGAGNDRMDGGDGRDSLFGGDGNDDLRGGAGDDVLRGEEGDDNLFGEAGVDDLDGGPGADIEID